MARPCLLGQATGEVGRDKVVSILSAHEDSTDHIGFASGLWLALLGINGTEKLFGKLK